MEEDTNKVNIFATKSGMTEDYAIEYENFMQTFKKTEVSGEECGELIMRMGHYYMRYNMRLVEAVRHFAAVKSVFLTGVDPDTQKPMSAAKADVLADATPEAATYQTAKAHLLNIEQGINALKALQKSLLQEYIQS